MTDLIRLHQMKRAFTLLDLSYLLSRITTGGFLLTAFLLTGEYKNANFILTYSHAVSFTHRRLPTFNDGDSMVFCALSAAEFFLIPISNNRSVLWFQDCHFPLFLSLAFDFYFLRKRIHVQSNPHRSHTAMYHRCGITDKRHHLRCGRSI